MVATWCSGYHYSTTSFNTVWTQVLRRFKSCLRRVEDSWWWGSLTVVPAGNKAKRLSSVNHTTKQFIIIIIIKYTIWEIIGWAWSHTKELLVLLHLGLEGINEADTDPKGRFESFKVTPSNDRALGVYAQGIWPGHSTREQLARGHFFEGLQNCMENKNEGNENKIILGDFYCTMNKMDGDNKTQRIYRCCSNYALSKLIVDIGLEGLWRRENPDSPEFIRYDRSFGKDSG